MDAQGDAIAAWSNGGGIWTNSLTTGSWSGESYETAGTLPVLVMNDAGDGWLMWVVVTGPASHLWVQPYSRQGGWGTAEWISEMDAGATMVDPAAAMNTAGDTFAVFRSVDGTQHRIYAYRHTAAGGWEGFQPLNSLDLVADAPRVAVDEDGTAVTVWGQSDGTSSRVWASRYSPAADWSTAEIIDAEDGYGARVAAQNGYIVSSWACGSNHQAPGSGWTTPADCDGIGSADVAMDPRGNAVIAWSYFDVVVARRFIAGVGWQDPVTFPYPFSGPGGPLTDPPRVAMAANGRAVVAWSQLDTPDDNLYNMWVNVFDEP
jgi:hypothetical protein